MSPIQPRLRVRLLCGTGLAYLCWHATSIILAALPACCGRFPCTLETSTSALPDASRGTPNCKQRGPVLTSPRRRGAALDR